MRIRSLVRTLARGGALVAAMLGMGDGTAAAQQRSRVVPAAVFVTWTDDPTTAVSIDWHLAPGSDIGAVEVRGPGISGWRRYAGQPIAGDGAWGAAPRPIGREHTVPVSYLAKARSANHGIFVTLDRRAARFQVVDTARVVFDSFVVQARRSRSSSVGTDPAAVARRPDRDR